MLRIGDVKKYKTGWQVDERSDAYGHWTIRFADGTENGDLNRQPIATVFSLNDAEEMVASHNASFHQETEITENGSL